jgi:hypothetical protein
LTLLILAGAPASAAQAQTADPIFAAWRWAPGSPGSRPAGLGGAFTGVADGGKAAYSNPAGLVQIPAWEVDLSTGERWAALSGGGLGRLRLSAYVTNTGDQRLELLDSSSREAGLAFGAQPFPRVKVGGALAWSHLSADGADEATTVAADSTKVRLTAGLLLTLIGAEAGPRPSLGLGLSYQPGFDWSAEVADGSTGEPAVSAAIRRPSLISAGLAWRATRWSFSAQGDLIRYHEVVDALRRNVGTRADGFRLPDAVEPRVGAELLTPLSCGCGVVALRGGIHGRSPGTLGYEGDDPVAAAAFAAGHWRTVATLGASFLTEHFGKALRLDLDARDLLDGPDLSFGMAFRF